MKILAIAALGSLLYACSGPTPPSNTVWQVKGAQLTLSVDSNHGAAIYSLIEGGFEYVNAVDLGREIQTAYQLEGQGEQNNPTEAGSSKGVPSQVLGVNVVGKVLQTSVHPSFWVPVNGQTYSPDTLAKKVTVDYNGITNVVRHDVSVTVAANHTVGRWEPITGYMNGTLTQLYSYTNKILTPVPGVNFPSYRSIDPCQAIILATADGAHAIGAFTPTGNPDIGNQCVAYMNINVGGTSQKWDVGIGPDIKPFSVGTHSWVVYYVVGTLEEVKTKLNTMVTWK